MASTSWLTDMAKRVREVERDADGNLTTSSFLNVCEVCEMLESDASALV